MSSTSEPGSQDRSYPHGVVSGTSSGARRAELRCRLSAGDPFIVAGVSDALGARLVDGAGFAAVYVTGAGVANAQFGFADLGLVSQSEMLEQTRRVVDATDRPVIVDADTGYGGPLATMRTTHQLAAAGASAMQIEDQKMPKRCGHFDGHQLEDTATMCAKLRAAAAVRDEEAVGDERIVIIARTDARSAYDLDEALRRGHAFLASGADVLFVESPRSLDEMERIGREFAGVPLLANIVEGGKTPMPTLAELGAMGFTIALYANFLMRAMAHAGQTALRHLAEHGSSADYLDHLLSWSERQQLFGLADFDALESRFHAEADDWRNQRG